MTLQQLPFKIHHLHLEDIQNPEHPSIYHQSQEYEVLIIRLPQSSEEEIEFFSHAYIVHQATLYRFEREAQKFQAQEPSYKRLYTNLDTIVDQTMTLMEEYHDMIGNKEDALYVRLTSEFTSSWLEMKKELTRIERTLYRSANALSMFIAFHQHEDKFFKHEFHDVLEHIERTNRSAALAMNKLDQLYNFYTMRTSEKMNQSVFILTLISAIFLPINLVVGFFGMNTGGLPWAEDPYGTARVIGLITALFMISGIILWFKQKKEG